MQEVGTPPTPWSSRVCFDTAANRARAGSGGRQLCGQTPVSPGSHAGYTAGVQPLGPEGEEPAGGHQVGEQFVGGWPGVQCGEPVQEVEARGNKPRKFQVRMGRY